MRSILLIQQRSHQYLTPMTTEFENKSSGTVLTVSYTYQHAVYE